MRYLLLVSLLSAACGDGFGSPLLAWFGHYADEVNVTAGLAQLRSHPGVIGAVAFMRYTVGPEGSLVTNYSSYPAILPALKALNITPLALVSTARFPAFNQSTYVAALRALFARPAPFLAALAGDMAAHGIAGANFDFEEDAFDDPALAAQYAAFLVSAEAALSLRGLSASADVGLRRCGAPCKGLARSRLSAVAVMDTYAQSEGAFLDALANATADFGRGQLVVGLETWPGFSVGDVALRFEALAARRVCNAAVWRLPIPDLWWRYLEAFAANASTCAGA